jgi:hypothetical protein
MLPTWLRRFWTGPVLLMAMNFARQKTEPADLASPHGLA